ncbi:MAG: D-alanine--D-alanine ligase [Dysgonamonadaceae bacterium]|jgi:D-alanine-D-alanine ligase|nr:D-alanine--D-alanine ligase [Dysgonamonadaceae bacterium]
MKPTIAIVAGGYSSEYVVSLKSARGIWSFIDKDRYNVYIAMITREKWVVQQENRPDIPIDKNDFSFIFNGQRTVVDFAYITIHGAPGENGQLQGYFDMLGIPHSCCGVLAASLTFNKYYCNNYVKSFGVQTAPSILLRKGETITPEEIIAGLGLPLFIKPSDGGSSFGTTKVTSPEQIQPAIEAALQEGNEAIMECFMPGTEVTCGCYKVQGEITVLPITEVVSKNEFFDYDAKYNPNSSEEITPARISNELTAEIQQLTAQIYDKIGAKGIIRVDYIISPAGEVRMLEINTTPGMTATSFIPQQIRAAGLNITEVLTEIIEENIHGNRY